MLSGRLYFSEAGDSSPMKGTVTMVLVVSADPIPLRTDSDGVVRVGSTRVPLDTVVTVFDLGASPEEIVQQFPALGLADVYAVIGYYLHHHGF